MQDWRWAISLGQEQTGCTSLTMTTLKKEDHFRDTSFNGYRVPPFLVPIPENKLDWLQSEYIQIMPSLICWGEQWWDVTVASVSTYRFNAITNEVLQGSKSNCSAVTRNAKPVWRSGQKPQDWNWATLLSLEQMIVVSAVERRLQCWRIDCGCQNLKSAALNSSCGESCLFWMADQQDLITARRWRPWGCQGTLVECG